MQNVCWKCGECRADKLIDPSGPYAICPVCGHRHPFRQLPLFIVGGASGTGKSAVCNELVGTVETIVALDADILWRHEFDRPQENYRDFFELWLRVCKDISQSGRPVVLFGAGLGVPQNLESCVELRYFSTLYYLALVCEDELLAERLRRRPPWRASGDPAYIAAHTSFNRWLRENADKTSPHITLLDTTAISVREATAQVAAWIGRGLSEEQLAGGRWPAVSSNSCPPWR